MSGSAIICVIFALGSKLDNTSSIFLCKLRAVNGVIGSNNNALTFPPNPPCANHVANVNAGSGTVRVAGAFVARIGDSTDAGAMTSGSSNVFSG